MFGCSWSPQLLHVECYGECGGWNACHRSVVQILWRWQTVVANQCQQNRLYLSSCFSCGLNLFVWSYICGRREKPSSMIYYKPCPHYENLLFYVRVDVHLCSMDGWMRWSGCTPFYQSFTFMKDWLPSSPDPRLQIKLKVWLSQLHKDFLGPFIAFEFRSPITWWKWWNRRKIQYLSSRFHLFTSSIAQTTF